MTELEIIGAPQSIFVRSVRMVCAEKAVAYRFTPARPHSPEVDCIHPFGKIPVMRHGGFTLFESKAISTYIDRAFPGPKVIPEDATVCGQVEQWVSVLNTTIFPSFITYFLGYFFPKTADGAPDRQSIEGSLPDLRNHFAILEHAVAKTGYLAGPGFTYADIDLLPSLAYLAELPESAELLKTTPSLSRYFTDHCQRASFVATKPPPMTKA